MIYEARWIVYDPATREPRLKARGRAEDESGLGTLLADILRVMAQVGGTVCHALEVVRG